jgi:hypothetical protein
LLPVHCPAAHLEHHCFHPDLPAVLSLLSAAGCEHHEQRHQQPGI